MTTSMRVLMPLSQFYPGGQTTHVVTLAKYLRRQGHEVTLLHTRPEGKMQLRAPEYIATLALDGVETLAAPDGCARERLRPFRWDVIHAHSTQDWGLARAEGRANRVPYVLTVHGLGCDRPDYEPLLADAAAVIAVGNRVSQSIEALASKVVVIENGVDLEVFRPAQDLGSPKVLYISRLDSCKMPGVKAVIEAAKILEPFLPITLQIVSTRPARKIREWAGNGTSVVFSGWTHAPETHVNTAHVVIGVGRVIREGLAAGCGCLVLGAKYGGPVLLDRLPGCGPHDFSARKPGLLEPDPDHLAADIWRLLAPVPRVRLEYAAAAREYAVQHFSAEDLAVRTSEVYAAALSAEPPA